MKHIFKILSLTHVYEYAIMSLRIFFFESYIIEKKNNLDIPVSEKSEKNIKHIYHYKKCETKMSV